MFKFLIVSVFLAGIVSAYAAAPAIKEIEVRQKDGKNFDRGYVTSHTRVKIGDEFSSSAVSRDVKLLLDTGKFTAVDASIKTIDDRNIKLIFTVKPKLRLAADPIIIGTEKLRKRKVRKLLELEKGDEVDDQVVGVAVNKVLEKYRDKSYPNAVCSWSFKPVEGRDGVVSLRLKFDEGGLAYVHDIEVVGNKSVSTAVLRKALERPSPFNPIRWFVKKRYEHYELAYIESGVKRVYMDYGFLDVKAKTKIAASPDGKKGQDLAIITVTEGTKYHIGKTTLKGVSVFPENELKRLISLKRGDTASLKGIEATADRLQAYYGNRGYLNSSARYLLIPNKDKTTVDVIFTVTEGELVRIRNIIIRGNTRTRDKVVRRELLVYPGEIYNQSRVKRSERRINNLGFFESVQVVPQRTSNVKEQDLVFDVREKRTGQFMLGAGFSSVDNLIGFIELSQGNFDILGWPNFTGGGQKLRLRAQIGSTRKDYDLSFTEPWFLNRRLSLGFNVYSRDRNYDDYDVETTGASVSLGKALPGANRINLRYNIEDSHITDVTDTNTYYELDSYDFETDSGVPYLFESEEDRVKSTMTLSLQHDTRNNPFVPTGGNKLRLSYSISGGPMGFDTDMYDVGLKTASYVPLWFGHVFSVRTRFEFVEAFGDTETVPLADKLFLGGGRTLRGFDYREVGPKVIRKVGEDEYYTRSYGGQSLFMANIEYTVPIVKGVRFAGFYDVGNVWADTYTLETSDLASSAGVGVRFDMPGFPIRIDRAWVIDYDDEYTDDDKWVIWIGYDN
jgi:outer membrane protein insertion porin family